MSHVGQAFARQRERLKLTQAGLGQRMGKTQAYVARIEGAKRNPRWTTVLEFARALELEPAFIPRQSLPAVEAVLNLTSDDEVPPFAGESW
ncbi:MAG: helix-turn-helix domain-containing protein [Vulcanimicrobiaceae bacterium]